MKKNNKKYETIATGGCLLIVLIMILAISCITVKLTIEPVVIYDTVYIEKALQWEWPPHSYYEDVNKPGRINDSWEKIILQDNPWREYLHDIDSILLKGLDSLQVDTSMFIFIPK